MKRLTLSSLFAFAAAMLCLSGTAHAQSVTITNFSFEDNAAGPNAPFVGVPSGFTSNFVGTQAPVYLGAHRATDGQAFAAAPLGLNTAFINIVSGSAVTATLTSGSLLGAGGIVAGDSYTFTAAIGNANGTGAYQNPGQQFISLVVGGNVVATTNATAIGEGSFADFSVTLTAAQSTLFAGQSLAVQFGMTSDGSAAFQGNFDNLRLTEVPEPATWLGGALLGGACLLGVQQRRRRTTSATLA